MHEAYKHKVEFFIDPFEQGIDISEQRKRNLIVGALQRYGIYTISHLCSFSKEQLLEIKGIGRRSVPMIEGYCKKYSEENDKEVWHMPKFSVEEMYLMCIYDTSDKNRLWLGIFDSLTDVYDPEMKKFMQGVLDKLSDMTKEEFSQLDFYAADDYDEEQEI